MRLGSIVMCALAAGVVRIAAAPSPASLRADVEHRIQATSGADVAVAFRTLDGRDELLIQPDVVFHAASTMKVPVMIELYRQAHAGRLRLDDQIPRAERVSQHRGRHAVRAVGRRRLGRRSLQARRRSDVLSRALCEAMITVSSNLAANVLIERLGPRNIQATTDTLGATGMHVLRGVEDQKAFDKGLNNTTTARALLTLMEKIAHGDAVDKSGERRDGRGAEAADVSRSDSGGPAARARRSRTRPARSRRFSTTRRSSSRRGRSCSSSSCAASTTRSRARR